MTDRTTITLTGDQIEAFEAARELIDSESDVVGAETAERGRTAGEVTNGEAVRVLAEAYTGQLEMDI
jgi:hypothetical protein